MNALKIIIAIAAGAALAACETTGSSSTVGVGPSFSSSSQVREADMPPAEAPAYRPLDVSIVVFDTGLPDDDRDLDDDEWPELRQAEARYMAVQLRDAVAATNRFGAVRVTPNTQFSSDLFVETEIIESDGVDLKLKATVTDSTGRTWYSKVYSYSVNERWYRNIRNADAQPFAPLYEAIASDLADRLRRQKDSRLTEITTVTDIRFAQNLSPDAFSDSLSVRRGRVELERVPAENDPMMRRVAAVRYRDQMFVDTLQDQYDVFAEDMSESYRYWQSQSSAELERARKARSKASAKFLGGLLLIAGAIAADSDNSVIGDVAAVGAGVAGGALLVSGWKDSQEARVHTDVIDELANSLDGELAPKVVELEDQTVMLSGTMEEQMQQWRQVLAEIWEAETLPEASGAAM
jgi:hypothetical protein